MTEVRGSSRASSSGSSSSTCSSSNSTCSTGWELRGTFSCRGDALLLPLVLHFSRRFCRQRGGGADRPRLLQAQKLGGGSPPLPRNLIVLYCILIGSVQGHRAHTQRTRTATKNHPIPVPKTFGVGLFLGGVGLEVTPALKTFNNIKTNLVRLPWVPFSRRWPFFLGQVENPSAFFCKQGHHFLWWRGWWREEGGGFF